MALDHLSSTDRLAFPASSDVRTSCPMERRASMISNSMFSFVYKRHVALCRLVLVNLSVDVARVSAHVIPGVPEIVGTKRRITLEERLVGGAEPTSLLQDPHRDSRANNAGLTAADIRTRVDAGKRTAQLLDGPLEDPAFSPSGTDCSNASNSRNPATGTLSRLLNSQGHDPAGR